MGTTWGSSTPLPPAGIRPLRVVWRCPVCLQRHGARLYLPLAELFRHLEEEHGIDLSEEPHRKGPPATDVPALWNMRDGELHA